MRRGWLALLLCVTGCVKPSSVTCADGRTCPSETLCDELHHQCVTQAQIDVCVPIPAGQACTAGTVEGYCRDGVCLAPTCGDGVVEIDDGELCDGAPPPVSCTDRGFDRGTTACSMSCTADLSGCSLLGWHRIGFESPDRLVAVFGTSATDVNAIGWYFVTSSGGGPAWWHYDGTSWTKRTMTLAVPAGASTNGRFEILDATGWGTEMVAVGRYTDFSNGNTTTQTGMHYDGSTWTVHAMPVTGQVKAVWGSAANDVFAVTGIDEIVHWNGSAWSSVGTLSGGSKMADVWGVNGELYTVGGAGRVEHYSGTWSTVPAVASLTTEDLLGVWGTSPDDVFAVGTNGTIVHYSSTTGWTLMTSPTTSKLQSVWGLAHDNVYATGYGIVLHYDGVGWTVMETPTATLIYAVWGANATDIHAVEWGGILHYSGDGWERPVAPPAAAPTLASIVGFDGAHIFAGEKDIWAFDGSAWTSTGLTAANGGEDLPYGPVQELWGSSPTDLYAAGGELWHYNGAWSQIVSYPDGQADGIWGTAQDNVYVVGGGGVIYHLTGTTWTQEVSGTALYLEAAWGSSANDVFVVGDNGTILHRGASGTWSPMASNTTEYLLSVSGTGPNDVFAAGYDGTVVHYDGTSWTPMTTSVGGTINRVLAYSPTDVFAIGSNGLLIHYDGMRWAPVRNPALAELNGVWALGRTLYAVGINSNFLELARRTPW